jgi:PAS domain S-box-containing protein
MYEYSSADFMRPQDASEFAQFAQQVRAGNQRNMDRLKGAGDASDLRSRVLATILDAVADGLIVLDENLTGVLRNVAAARISGWQGDGMTREQMKSHFRLYFDESLTPLPVEQEPSEVARREKRRCESIIYVVGETLPAPGRWLRVHAAPILDDEGNVVGVVTLYSDITEQIALQRQREGFAALMTHDLMNHLAAEEVLVDLILQSGKTEFGGQTLELLETLRASSERFRGIAGSLLDVYKSALFVDNQYAQEFAVEPLVQKAVELSSLESKERNVRVAVTFDSGSVWVRGLPGVFQHVIHNLVQNAIEASPPRTIVDVAVSSRPGMVVVKIRDSGVGMKAREIAALFDPQSAAGRTPTLTASAGFGFYMSAKLIEGQGGKVHCTSQPGKGTTVTVTMPALYVHVA